MTTTDKPVNLEGPEDYCPNCHAWVLHATGGSCPWCEKPLAKAIQPRQDRVVRINDPTDYERLARARAFEPPTASADDLIQCPQCLRFHWRADEHQCDRSPVTGSAEPTYDDMAPAKTPQLRHGWAEHVPSSESAPGADWLPLAVFCGLWLLAIAVLGAVLVLGHLGILTLAGVTL